MSNETADPTTFPHDPNSPDEELDSPAFVQAAKLTKKIGDLPPDARPNHTPDAPPRAAAQEHEKEKEDLSMPQPKNATVASALFAAIPIARKLSRNSSTGATSGISPKTTR